jgi:hypothetical protein
MIKNKLIDKSKLFLLILIKSLGFILIAFGVFEFAVCFLPYDLVKNTADTITHDGSLDRLTKSVFQQLPKVLIPLAITTLLTGVLFTIQPILIIRFLKKVISFLVTSWKILRVDFNSFFKTLKANLPTKWEWIYLLPIIVVGAFLRFLLISRPLEYDEAYTYNEFARHTFKYIFSEYYVVNNHVFHTLLVKLSALLFGSEPWAIRIPVFFFGLALVLATFLLAKKLYGQYTAILAAILVALTPILIDKSVSARGYIIISFFFIINIYLITYLRKRNNIFGWGLLIISQSLGVFTNPIMLFPIFIVYCIAFYPDKNREIIKTYSSYKKWFKYLILSGLYSGFLILVFYSAILRHYGVSLILNNNKVVVPLSIVDYLKSFPQFMTGLWTEWMTGLPLIAMVLLGLGLIGNLIFLFINKFDKTPLLLMVLMVWFVLLIIQRPFMIIRVWLWMVPILIICSARGLVQLFSLVKAKSRNSFLVPFIVIVFLFWGYYDQKFVYPIPFSREDDTPIEVSQFLSTVITDNDVVAVSIDSDARFWYYFNQLHIPEGIIRNVKNQPFNISYVIVNPNHYESLDSVVTGYGPDKGFLELSSSNVVFIYKDTIVYSVKSNPTTIDAEFNK